MPRNKVPALDHVLQRLAFLRMFLLLVALSVMAIGALAYVGEQTLENRQHQMARFMARFVDGYLDQAARILDAAARAIEAAPAANLAIMNGILKAYGYFNTLYYLDASGKIRLLVPPDPRYLGLDMSNMPHFKPAGEKHPLIISRPFISLRTGDPTVYLIKRLAQGGQLAGELDLGALQHEITRSSDRPGQESVFIMDQFGMLLAHPVSDLVRQQTNQSNLKIFRDGLAADATLVYRYAERLVLGSSARIERTGWVVIDQVPLFVAFSSYAWALGLTLLASGIIWLALAWNLRKQLQRHVVSPLVQLSRGIGALTNGDFNRGKTLAAMPTAFAELTTLATNFQQMSDALEARQDSIQESEHKYRSLAEGSPDNIMRYDKQGRLIYINRQMGSTVGVNFRELIDKHPRKHLDIAPPKGYLTRLKEVIQTGRPDEIEVELPNPEGKLRTYHVRFVAERNNEGKIIGALALGRDITKRKQAEQSIRKLSQAIEQSPVSIVITDVQGTIEFVNTKFTQVTGYPYDEVIGRRPNILKSGETPDEAYRRLWQTIAAGDIWQGEFHNRKKNGELFWEHATIAPVRDADHVITHYVAVKEDITERKILEEQLRQTQKMEAVGQLAGGVAHDFNNMLGVIIGHAELALAKVGSDNALRKNLQEVLSAGLRSAEITRQLLAFARKQTITPKILDLNETVEDMLKLLRRTIGEDIDLTWLPRADLWPVKMDPSQVDQILANLCVNARDAISGVGKVTIETQKVCFDDIYCREHQEFIPGEYAMLAVSDNGSGMDKATLAKIFEPFFTTKAVGKGTGLGLATVYGIVQQNKGIIHVYSEPGIGSIFKVYLPRHADPSSRKPEPSPAPQQLSGHETILVVEDEVLHLEFVELMLKSYGYQVLTASSPGRALLAAKQHTGKIQLLLTDLIMPEMNGRELSSKMTSLFPDIVCLYMSGYTKDIIAHQGILDQGVHFIQKPFSMQHLATKVREILDAGYISQAKESGWNH